MNELVEAGIHPSSQEGTQTDSPLCVPDSSPIPDSATQQPHASTESPSIPLEDQFTVAQVYFDGMVGFQSQSLSLHQQAEMKQREREEQAQQEQKFWESINRLERVAYIAMKFGTIAWAGVTLGTLAACAAPPGILGVVVMPGDNRQPDSPTGMAPLDPTPSLSAFQHPIDITPTLMTVQPDIIQGTVVPPLPPTYTQEILSQTPDTTSIIDPFIPLATATIESLPTLSAKKTEIAPSLTPLTQEVSPTPTATEIQPSATQESITPTATVTEIEQGDWFDEHFLPEEQLPEGAILMNNLTREQVQKLTITGPGQVLGRCPFKSFQKKLTEGRIISSVHIDLTQKNGNFCVFGTTREKTIRNGIATKFSTLSPVDQDVLANKYIRKLKIFEEKILNLGYDPIIDLFENFTFQYVYNEKGEPYDVNMFIYNNPNPPTGEWPLREVIDIPLSEPTATTTP